MNSLYYTTHKTGKTVKDGKVMDDLKAYRDRVKNDFCIQVFGNPIMPKDAKSIFFKVRNLVLYIACTFVDDKDNAREAHLSEACYYTSDIKKPLVVIEGIRFDDTCEEITDAVNSIYEIINYEAKEIFELNEDVAVYWSLSDEELEMLKKYCSKITVNIENNQYYVILQNRRK